MGLWNFLGGNKIGPGHPRYERELRKHNERQKLHLKSISISIMDDGMPGALRYENEEDIINVLKQYPNCPQFTEQGYTWGKSERFVTNWKQAQKWLKAKENPEQENTEYTKQLEQRIKEQEERIKKLEEQSFYEKE